MIFQHLDSDFDALVRDPDLEIYVRDPDFETNVRDFDFKSFVCDSNLETSSICNHEASIRDLISMSAT